MPYMPFWMVSRTEVERGDVSAVVTGLKSLWADPNLIRDRRGTLSIVIDGYNSDPRKVSEIPEARAWWQKLYTEFPYIGYFLTSEGDQQKSLSSAAFPLRKSMESSNIIRKSLPAFSWTMWSTSEGFVP